MRNLIKQDIQKQIIKKRYKELRQRFFKLPNLKWMIVILLLSSGILISSYYIHKCNPWLSGVLVSAGCGGITGLVLYFLSNLRNNKYALLQKEFSALTSIRNITNQIKGFQCYHKSYRLSWGKKRDIFEDGLEIVSLLEELQLITDNMYSELYDKFFAKGDNLLSYENLQMYKSRLLNLNAEDEAIECMDDIVEHFVCIEEIIFDLINEKEDQLMFLGRIFI